MKFSKLKGFYAKWESIREQEKGKDSEMQKAKIVLRALKREIETNNNKQGLKERLRNIVNGRHKI